MEFPFVLDKFQQDAIDSIAKRGNSVLVNAATGSGKTIIAEFAIDWAVRNGKRAFYTAPVKALLSEKYRDFTHKYSHTWNIGLYTGDWRINPDAPVLLMTTEILRNMLYSGRPIENLGVVVFDEVHWISDPFRGYAWEESIIRLSLMRPPSIPPPVLVMLSATVGNPETLAEWVGGMQERRVECYGTSKRVVPLKFEWLDNNELTDFTLDHLPDPRPPRPEEEGERRPTPTFDSTLDFLSLEERLPAIWFNISKSGCETMANCYNGYLLSPPDQIRVSDRFHEIVPKVYHGMEVFFHMDRIIRRGVAYHHSGMLPSLREAVEQLFNEGLLRVIFATETLSVGINMPSRSVILTDLTKPSYTGRRDFTFTELTQLIGRAGRRGKDPIGYVIFKNKGGPRPLVDILRSPAIRLEGQLDPGSYTFILKELNLKSSPEEIKEHVVAHALGSEAHKSELAYLFRERDRLRSALLPHRPTMEKIATLHAELNSGAKLTQKKRAKLEQEATTLARSAPGMRQLKAEAETLEVRIARTISWVEDAIHNSVHILRHYRLVTPDLPLLTPSGSYMAEFCDIHPILFHELFNDGHFDALDLPTYAIAMSLHIEDHDSKEEDLGKLPDDYPASLVRHILSVAAEIASRERRIIGKSSPTLPQNMSINRLFAWKWVKTGSLAGYPNQNNLGSLLKMLCRIVSVSEAVAKIAARAGHERLAALCDGINMKLLHDEMALHIRL